MTVGCLGRYGWSNQAKQETVKETEAIQANTEGRDYSEELPHRVKVTPDWRPIPSERRPSITFSGFLCEFGFTLTFRDLELKAKTPSEGATHLNHPAHARARTRAITP